jgi:hypothetical protein
MRKQVLLSAIVILSFFFTECKTTESAENLCDLVITDVYWEPEIPHEGDTVVFFAVLKNIGSSASPEGVIHGVIWRVNNGTVNWSDYHIESLAPGESVTLKTSGGSDYFAIEGIHKLEVSVDPVWDINRIAETSKLNNSLATTLTIAAPKDPQAGMNNKLPLINPENIRLKSFDLGGYSNIRGVMGSTVVDKDSKTYTITSIGHEVGLHSPADWHHFAYVPLEGDFEISVRVDEVVAPFRNYDGAAVLVARESLDGSARILDLKSLVPGSLHGNGNFSGRKVVGGNLFSGEDKLFSGGGAIDKPGNPVWLRMRRTGNRFLAYYSHDGRSWNSLNSIYSDMPHIMYVGIGVSAFAFNIPVTARFSELSVHGKLTPEQAPRSNHGNGKGLLAEYYDGRNFDTYLFTRIDTLIDFSFVYGDPVDIRMGYEDYSIRWTGFLEPETSGKHTIWAVVDDGAKVWIDDELVIDSWKDQATIGLSYDMELVKGKKYPIRLEYYDGKIGGKFRLLWESPEFPLELIPTSQLHPAETNAELYAPKVQTERITQLSEAENVEFSGSARAVYQPFASSSKVVEIPAEVGAGLIWKGIDGGQGGVHYFNIIYYSPASSWLESIKNIYVNNRLIDQYHFFPPGDGGGSYILKVELEPGRENSIAIIHETNSKGKLMVDFLGLDNTLPVLPVCPATYK